MRIQKSRPLSPFPDYGKIKDEIIKEFCQNLAESLTKMHRNLTDDLTIMQNLDTVDSLPTATSEYRGRLIILKGSGTGTDKLYLGISTGSDGYCFKEMNFSSSLSSSSSSSSFSSSSSSSSTAS